MRKAWSNGILFIEYISIKFFKKVNIVLNVFTGLEFLHYVAHMVRDKLMSVLK